MNVYIDESGTFVSAPRQGSWNAVAALALPEAARRGLEQALADLKNANAEVGNREIKINEVSEGAYVDFLAKLGRLNGALFCIATDAGLNTPTSVAEHQRIQVAKVLKHVDKMRHEGGRRGLNLMAKQIARLSPQLYVQLFCQIELMYEV